MINSVSFEPVVGNNSKLLILGTMPGIKSLEMQQYYAHERNAFWPIIFKHFDEPFTTNYSLKLNLLSKNGIVLWDTLQFCYREGSLDSNIKDAVPNNIMELLNNNRSIKNVIFNGKGAEKYYDKFQQRIDGISYHSLPSTSPANARVKFEDKLNAWAIILSML